VLVVFFSGEKVDVYRSDWSVRSERSDIHIRLGGIYSIGRRANTGRAAA
jgi:hypothetical protein